MSRTKHRKLFRKQNNYLKLDISSTKKPYRIDPDRHKRKEKKQFRLGLTIMLCSLKEEKSLLFGRIIKIIGWNDNHPKKLKIEIIEAPEKDKELIGLVITIRSMKIKASKLGTNYGWFLMSPIRKQRKKKIEQHEPYSVSLAA